MVKKMPIVEAFNVLYGDVVNKSDFSNKNGNARYDEAKNFVQRGYEELNAGVMEFLAMYMLRHPNGKVEFWNSREGLGLVCNYDDIERIVAFNLAGVIIRDEKTRVPSEKEN